MYYTVLEIPYVEAITLLSQKTTPIQIGGHIVDTKSLRYKVFKNNPKCVICGRVGVSMKLQKNFPDVNKAHFNLYSEDGVMLTKDHILPKSKGGKDSLDNLQTMCAICNHNKADQVLN